ncbi:methyltransferase domain-containing protein [Hydrogenivirga sp. 128-5-R1-1]|uniref:class I SAM-dependent DNA methyltransferase n=1 Tax=Hydrogenivirga sp. 128-5-R1-1 TaxID=392423 RepID=UPI00015F1D04|nr:methyltransferase domain-containing protein [Hydrogenivirga sp. 128-5-R1-1]EDP74046.1 methyltransferase, putative [Hydrogenivirga sp. 128-5-R1-1]
MSKFDQLAKEWDEKPLRVENAKKIGQAIIDNILLSKDWIVMDFGAGTGLLTFYIQPFVKQIDAVDNSQGMLDVLKEKAEKANVDNINPILKDLEKNHLGEDKYDLIVSSMTLHHIKNVEKFLKKLYKALKKGGYVAIADLEEEEGTFHSDNEGVHHFGFDKEKVKELYERAGFKDIDVFTVNVINKEGKDYPVFLAIGRK